MENNCVFHTLRSQFGLEINPESIGKRLLLIDELLSEVTELVGTALKIQQRNVRTTQENQLKCIKERNSRLVKEKLEILEAINILEADTEKLTQAKTSLKESIMESRKELHDIEDKAEKFKAKMDEMNSAIENRQRSKTAYSIAIGWYQIFLQMKIFMVGSHPNRFVISFGTIESQFKPNDHRVVLLRQNSGYRIEGDERLLTARQMKAVLVTAWEAFNASSSQHSSVLSSTQGLIDNSRFSK